MNETHLNGESKDIVAENIQQLKQLFPEVFAEDNIDFDKLKTVMGEYVDEDDERYNFTWWGKSKALRLAQTPSTGTLRPCPEESKNWDKTHNLYIEGDNLEVLKLLQKNYHNKIKMIYIDPPYNTGKDFIYPDDFKDAVKNYKMITGYMDDEGRDISVNIETSGRYHTNWLNMIYPRLRLARNLLRKDGFVFISIDNNEMQNLRKICDEVFGEENFIENFIWDKKNSAKGVPPKTMVVNVHEYVLCYSKGTHSKLNGELRTTETFTNPDNDPRGPWRLSNIKSTLERGKDKFSIFDPATGNEFTNYWAFSKTSLERMIEENRIIFPKSIDGLPKQKEFFSEFSNPYIPIMSQLGVYHSQDTSEKAIDRMMEDITFLYRKPIKLLKRLIGQGTGPCDIVLDFFSGSATTAHAVIRLNAESDGRRKFIMVQLPEPLDEKSETYKAGYQNISEIGKERIRRAGEKIKAELEEKYQEQQGKVLVPEEEKVMNPEDLDIGFKVFKLDSSNLRKWQPDANDLDASLFASIENFVEGRTELDVVYEIMLKYGIDLTLPIAEFKVGEKSIYSVGMGALMICLDKDISIEVAQEMVQLKNELQPEVMRVVFRDTGFKDDSAKTNTKEILRTNGVDEIVSI